MQKTVMILLIIISFMVSAAFAGQVVTGGHAENSIGCSDCHKTDNPVKKPEWQTCLDCHGDMKSDDMVLHLKDNFVTGKESDVKIHSSHLGTVECTKCHTSHKATRLYCNGPCHHQFEGVKVP